LTLQNPVQKIPLFQFSQINRTNINTPIKGKKLYHFVIQLLSADLTKSNVNLDISNSNSNRVQTQKSLHNYSVDKKLEDIYAEILEQSLCEEGNKTNYV